MNDLVSLMTQENPAARPSIEDVLREFEFSRIQVSLSKGKPRSAIASQSPPKVLGIFRQARQSIRTVKYIVSRRPAIPNYYS